MERLQEQGGVKRVDRNFYQKETCPQPIVQNCKSALVEKFCYYQ